ncbi:MAG: carbon monoxide dehydrogenase subunit G [Proteobacteria bacterium]|nr:carbon monoxide dehydrogenase subunit G [Pseudomonadota bacterium]
MDLSGEQLIPVSRELVWQALNDIEVLKACIPGCETIAWTGDGQLEAVVMAKIGPVKARFTGLVSLTNMDPPNSYTISGEGKGGAAGFAKGGADVTLTDAEGGTLLRYEVKAQVGGKLAQVGARLIDAAAKKMAGDFFAAFNAAVVERSGGGPTIKEAQPEQAKTGGLPLWLWAAGLAAIVVLSLAYWAQRPGGGG